MNPKPARAGMATTAGLIFIWFALSTLLRTVVNLVITIINRFGEYPFTSLLITFMLVGDDVLVAVALLVKKKNHLFTAAFALLTLVEILQILFYGFSWLNLLALLTAAYTTVVAAFAVKNPPVGLVKYTWFIPVVLSLAFCIWNGILQIRYMRWAIEYGDTFMMVAQHVGFIVNEILSTVAYFLTMFWLATPQPQPWRGQPMMAQGQMWQGQPQPWQGQPQPWQGQPGQWQGSQGEMVRWTTQPWQAPQGQPQPWQQPTQPVQQSQPWQAPPQVQQPVQQSVQQPVQPQQTWQQPQNPQQDQ